MIRVDRARVADPFALNTQLGRRAARERARIAVMMERGELNQRRADFSIFVRPEVREALTRLFHNKCAYCETPLVGARGDIEQYRPKGSVVEAPQHFGYWWLASEWSNLLIACMDCNRRRRTEAGASGQEKFYGKHNRFPLLDEGTRAYAPTDDIALENPLILDPTVDDPTEHLIYSDTGELFSETERGNATISILGLNRTRLLEQRRATSQRFTLLVRNLSVLAESTDGGEKAEQTAAGVIDMLADDAPYAGMVRQFAQNLKPLVKHGPSRLPPTDYLASVGAGTHASPVVTRAHKKRAAKVSHAYRTRMSDYSLTTDEGVRRYMSQRRAIEAVSIRNIRGIRSLNIDLAAVGAGAGGWLMFLGENGTGKSTVLQAIALVLAGSDYVVDLIKQGRLRSEQLVRFRCRSGGISVKLSGFDKPHRLTVFRNRFEFVSPTDEKATIYFDSKLEGTGWTPQMILAGYGATRLLPRRSHDPAHGGDFARVDNLFDPFVPLLDAQAWLAGLDSNTFDRTAIVLKDLLAIDPDARLVREGGHISVRTPNSNVPLGDLSDGYQTVIAATADILEILSRLWPNPTDAEGIVLIDELDAHLHPTWQMQIVGSLRRALPGVQFITTTHQPLCLRGLIEGEVVVMRRDENGGLDVLTDLPSPADFRVDQLLTSAFFGLNSTLDPETEQTFDRYYALLALDDPSDSDQTELQLLKNELEQRRQMGETQRESLYLEAIDKILARQKTGDRIPAADVRAQAVEDVSAIWQRMMAVGIEGAGGGA